MELHQFRYFLALARTLNFTRAAEQCDITQSALTRSIQKLESELGGPLVYRERNLTQLTDLAKIVLPMLERTVEAADSAQLQAKEFRTKDIAPLRIGLAPTVSASLLVNPLVDLANMTQGLRIDLVEHGCQRLVEGLLEGEIHAALANEPAELPDRIQHWPLFEERYVALMARDHPYAKKASLTAEDVRNGYWLMREGCDVLDQFLAAFFASDERPKVAHHGRLENHLQWLAVAGLGLLLAPEHAPLLPGIVARPVEGNPVRRRIGLFVVAGRRFSPTLAAFIKTIRVREWSIANSEDARTLAAS